MCDNVINGIEMWVKGENSKWSIATIAKDTVLFQ